MTLRSIRILLVEDNPADSRLVREMLVDHGAGRMDIKMACVGSLGEAVQCLEDDVFDVMLLDLALPDGHGLDLVAKINRLASWLPVVILTGLSDEIQAIKAVQEGAQDYLVKGEVDGDILLRAIRYAIERKRFEKASRHTRDRGVHYDDKAGVQRSKMVGVSAAFKDVLNLAATLAKTSRTSVLIQGETGTGKGLIANFIHNTSNRREGPFITLNCSSIPSTLLESEMFGYERGAFTGAKHSKKGLLEIANGGTIFLDEIGDMEIALQPKLLQFIENRTFRKVGGTREVKVDVRIIAATNKDLAAQVREKMFREDLYFRLKVMVIKMPPLRERKEDIMPLFDYFLTLYSKEMGYDVPVINPEALEILLRYPWPGNVRELKNVIEMAIILSGPSGEIEPQHLPQELHAVDQPTTEQTFFSKDMTLDELNRMYILHTLDKVKGNKARAARILGITYPTLIAKLKKYVKCDGSRRLNTLKW